MTGEREEEEVEARVVVLSTRAARPTSSRCSTRGGDSEPAAPPVAPKAASQVPIFRARRTNHPRIGLLLGATLAILSALECLPARAGAALGECDFDRYLYGCYSRANLVCDQETNRCKCHSDFPVLVENRLCAKRAKANEICHYNDQCDTANGLQCLRSDTFVSCQQRTTDNLDTQFKCRCLKYDSNARHQQQQHLQRHHLQHSTSYDANYSGQRARGAEFAADTSNNNNNNFNSPSSKHLNSNTSGNQSTSILSSLFWSFLTLSFICLLALLCLIRFQLYFGNRGAFHHSEDRLSINSEPDVPPPYEVAIRMKV